MNKKYNILLYLFLFINCQNWWEETNVSNKDDSPTKYKYRFTDFYLCSDRKYRVHYLNSDWSEEFTACQPAGNCKDHIDGIAISGGQNYNVRINPNNKSDWLNETNEYNISNNNGYAGKIGKEIRGIYIYGGDYYNSGYYFYQCSNEKTIAERIAEEIFEKKEIDISYNETEIYNDQNNNISIKIQLLNLDEINFKGSIRLSIENYDLKYAYWGGSIGNYINSLLQDNFRLYYEDIKHHLEESLYLIIANGNVEFTFNWPKKRIEIDASIRILYNYCGYRGGFRINIY